MPMTRRPERAARSYVNEYAPENNQSGTPDRGANQSASHDHSRYAPFAKAASSGTIGGRSKPARARRNRARLGKNRRDLELARSAGPCPLSAIRGWAGPEQMAQVVVFLASDAASLINGAVVPVDGAWSAR